MSKKYALLGFVILFFSCTKVFLITERSARSIEVNESIAVDKEAGSIILPYRTELEKSMNSVLCVSSMPMEKARPESELGNLVADLTLKIGRELYGENDNESIDFCYLNHGGLRASLPKGNITRGHVFSLMPFENELVVVTLSTNGLDDLLSYVYERGGDPLAGIEIDFTQDPWEVRVNGQPADTDREYKVITTDYLANGGDRMEFFTQGHRVKIEQLEMKMRDAIMLHFERIGKADQFLKGKLDSRIKL